MSQLSAVTWTVQFIGSIAACARNGSWYTASIFLAEEAKALATSPSLPGDDAGILRGDIHLLDSAGGRDICVRTVVPVDVERGQALHGRPHMIADHRDGIIEPHHLAHALDRHRLAVVNVDELAAKHWTSGHGGDLHAGNDRIDAEHCLAVHFVGRVDTLGGRTDEREVLGILERDLVRYRQLRRRVRQSSIIEPLPGRRMEHLALFGAAGGRIDIPARRRRRYQHDASGSAGATKRLPVGRHRCRAAGDLKPNEWIGIQLVVRRCGLEGHLREVDFQLFGDEHAHRGVGALSHLDLRHDECHAVIRANADEGVGTERFRTYDLGLGADQLG